MNVLKKHKGINAKELSKILFLSGMLAWPLIQFAIFYVYMNYNNILMAFKGMYPNGDTYWVGLKNFIEVFNGADTEIIFISVWNNLKMSFITTIIGLPLNILFAFYLYKKKFGSTAIRIVYMLPSMVAGIVMTMLFMKFVELGLPKMFEEYFGASIPNLIRNNNTAFGVQVFYTLWLGFSSSLLIYSNAMFAIDESTIEAGVIDGTTPFLELWYIVVPMIFPTISTYVITGVSSLLTLSGSLYVFYGLNDVPKQTYMLGYYMFRIGKSGELTQYPMASAVSVLITLVSLPLLLGVRWLCERIDPMREINEDIS